MKIWQLFKAEGYDCFTPTGDFNGDDIQSFDGRKKKEHWVPLPVTRMEPEKGLALGDTPGGLTACIPVFSERALEVLRPLIKDSVEELEIAFEEGKYMAINVTAILDVIDYEKSQYEKHLDGHGILYFKNYFFRECDDLKQHHIFKIVDESNGIPFVSDAFKRAVEENGLEGFKFRLLWDSETGISENAWSWGSDNVTEESSETVEDDKNMEGDTCFSYVGEIDQETRREIMIMTLRASTIFKIHKFFKSHDFKDGRALAEQIYKIVDKILKTGKYPKEYDGLMDVACGLGCLFGYALISGYGWKWMEVGESPDDAMYCVVSPDGYWVNPSIQYLYRILTKQNPGVDGENDNTVLLLYNMLEESMKTPPEKKLTLVW